jgi:F-type H+-transporting ATPase subunit gamma
MASVKSIRQRVRSVANTKKITRAMKLVAAAKLRRATEAVSASRPYAIKMREVLSSLMSEVETDSHPLFRREENPRVCLLVPVTSNRGLCGAFNSSVLRRLEVYRREAGDAYAEIRFAPIGRKAQQYISRKKYTLHGDVGSLVAAPNRRSAASVAHEITRMFVEGEVDEVYLVYNEFVSALRQTVVVEPLLPLTQDKLAIEKAEPTLHAAGRIYEPSKQAVFDGLLPQFVESQVLRSLLESNASEMGARMTAMDNATRNASELIDRLTLEMNRVRQAGITKELMEITSGSESLKD